MGAPFSLRGYVVERPLGSGASGEVWRARAAASGAPVALKRIRTADDGSRWRACAEAALLRALDHPSIVRLHDAVPAADSVVLVLDLADGGSLAELLAARGRLTPGEVITALAPVAAALAYLHEAGFVHGDVSPGNVLFTADGAPLLSDVGVARLRDDDGEVRATPAYVDPTVAAGHLPGPGSDLFMLAGVALHALTGEPPWPGDPAAALERSARASAGDPIGGWPDTIVPSLDAAGVPPPMSAVLLRALDPDPARRGTAAEFALDLRHAGRPVAVELGAGRPRPEVVLPWSGPRHAAPGGAPPGNGAGDGIGGHAVGSAPADPGRPNFSRPHEVPGAEPPTRMVRPRPRPVIPRSPSGGRFATLRRRRVALLAAGVTAAVAAAGGIAWAATRGHPAPPVTRPRAEVETLTASPSTPGGRPGGSASASAWPRALARLDAARADAFAARDPTGLRGVYAAAPLAAADTALLNRLVPPGCGLRGARTRYADLVVERADRDRAALIVTATLPPSELVCSGRVRATAPGAGPTRLRILLVRTPAGIRIAAQAMVTG